MLRGIYTSGMGMLMQEKKMDVISNNLANVNTNGYKKDSTVFTSFGSILTKRINDYYVQSNPSGVVGSMNLSSDIGQVFTDYSQGTLITTGKNTDFAISGSSSSFFSVEIEDNSNKVERYTRDGAFQIDASGKLVTSEGFTVLGEDGPITLDAGDFNITDSGEVIQNGEQVAKLKIKTFKDTGVLRKAGENLVEVEGTAEEESFKGRILQGNLENSNVNPVREMIDMISVMRAYEASQKIVKAQDDTLSKAVNEVGSIR